MPPQEQADLWMALRDRMKVSWTDLTLQEKKAGMYLSCYSYHNNASTLGEALNVSAKGRGEEMGVNWL